MCVDQSHFNVNYLYPQVSFEMGERTFRNVKNGIIMGYEAQFCFTFGLYAFHFRQFYV